MRFNFKGTKIYIGFLFAAASTLMLLFDDTEIALFSFFGAVLHEMGHLAMMAITGEKPQELRLSVFGMRIKRNQIQVNARNEILLSLAGPAVNIIMFTIFFVISRLLDVKEFLIFSSVNLSLGLFNLLPIAELDGEHILSEILKQHMTSEKAEKTITAISFLIIVPLAATGFYILIKSRYNFSLLLVCAYLVLLTVLKKKKI